MAQYEPETRTSKAEITEKLSSVLDVSPKAIDLPDIDSYVSLMHIFFALEDRYGLKIGEIDGELCLRLDKSKGTEYRNVYGVLMPSVKNKNGSTDFETKVSRAIALYKQPASHLSPLNKINKPV